MKISIVIPVYNQQDYLADAIESALSQTIRCEVIVVNDGSTDHSGDIAKNYPVKLINQVNKGLASARNTGIMNATTDYILFLDSDDLLQENCAEKLLQIAETTGADVVAGSFKTFGIENTQVILMSAPTLEDFKVANRIGYSTLIKRETLLEVGGYSPRMAKGYEDLHLWFNLLIRGKLIVTTQDILWLYRTRTDSMISESVKYHDELMAQIKKDFPQAYE